MVSSKLLPKAALILLVCSMLFSLSESAHEFLSLLEDPSDISTLVTAASFLANYGYIAPEKGNAPPEEMDATEMADAIRTMQKYADVNQTGILDQATVKMIQTSRCGVHDEPDEIKETRIEGNASRRKRYAVAGLQYKWNKNDLKYKIINYPDSSTSRITRAHVREDTARAFKVWSDVTPLSFAEVSDEEAADVEISFGSYYHSDIERDPTFDGPGGTLGHAFLPNGGWGDTDGDVHLDDSETFIHQEFAQGTDFFNTVSHEIGHALGMSHATDRESLMYPYDKGYIPDFTLPRDDILGIQLLYGPNPDAIVVATPEHEICSRGVDSLTMIKKVLYVFSGKKFWRFSGSKDMIGPVEGTVSSEYFNRLPRGFTGVCTRWDKKLVVFKGKNYWTYDGTSSLEQDQAMKIAELGGVPKSPTAVMHDSKQRHTYFFKWSKVWKYDEEARTVMDGFPTAVHKAFNGMPAKSRVRAAYIDKRGDQYLLVGRQYYRFPGGQGELDPEYPVDFMNEYFGCRSK